MKDNQEGRCVWILDWWRVEEVVTVRSTSVAVARGQGLFRGDIDQPDRSERTVGQTRGRSSVSLDRF